METRSQLEPYVALEVIAARLRLPISYIRKRAEDGTIPSLNINGRLRFCPSRVKDALDSEATERAEVRPCVT